mgnify:CR=1 FL=1
MHRKGGGYMLSKKDMVLKIVSLYGQGSSIALYFANLATKKEYRKVLNIYKDLIKHYQTRGEKHEEK